MMGIVAASNWPGYSEVMNDSDVQKNGISHTIFAQGDSEWYRKVAVPFAQEIGGAIPRHVGEFPTALRQRMTRGAVNDFLSYAVIGVTLYVAKKVADDFYEVVLKPPIRKCLEALNATITGANRKAKKVFVSNIWYGQYDVVVSVSVVGKDFAEIVSQLNLIDAAHTEGLRWIRQRGVSAPVHHYRIECGKVNAEPLLLERADQAANLELKGSQNPGENHGF